MITLALTENAAAIAIEALAMQLEQAVADEDGHSAEVLAEVMDEVVNQFEAQTGRVPHAATEARRKLADAAGEVGA